MGEAGARAHARQLRSGTRKVSSPLGPTTTAADGGVTQRHRRALAGGHSRDAEGAPARLRPQRDHTLGLSLPSIQSSGGRAEEGPQFVSSAHCRWPEHKLSIGYPLLA